MPMSNVVEAAAGKVDATTINNGQIQGGPETVKTGSVGGADYLPTFFEEVLRTKAVRALSPEGEEFKKLLIERLAEEGVVCEILHQSNCYLFHDNAASIGVLFEEHLPLPGNDDMLPKSNYINQAYAEAEHAFKQFPIVSVEICAVNDYDRVNQWVYYISRVLRYSYRDVKVFTLQDIVKDSQQNLFRVIINKHAVDRVVNDMSIHSVLPHYQYGIVLEMCTDRSNSQYKNNYQWNPADDLNWTPIMVIPGYTSFVIHNTLNFNDVKYIPRVHISEPICLFPTLKMLPLVISLALQYFVSGQMWKEPFSQYDAKSPNIGSLWIKPETGEPDFVTDINMREQFIAARCTSPVLMIDFSHGRNSIPGMSLLASDKFQPVFLNAFDEFFRTSNVYTQFGSVIQTPAFCEYTGVVSLDGKFYDSKCFDYFKVLSACGNQREILDKFINVPLPNQPDVKLCALKTIGYNIKSMYSSALCLVNPNMILEIANAIGSQLNVINAIGIDNRYYADMSMFDRAATVLRDGMMRNSGMFFTNNGRNLYNNDPFGNNTSWNVWGSRF